MPSSPSKSEWRRLVKERAGGCCEYCKSNSAFATYTYALDHIQPISKGGKDELQNLAFSCQGCNTYKYNKTTALDPISLKEVPMFNPRKDSWSKHFAWSGDFTRILALTDTGRASLFQLRLNRPSIVNLRKLLYQAGMHPPKEK